MKPNLDQIRGIRDVANLMAPRDLYPGATTSLRDLMGRHRFRPADQRLKGSARELLRRWNPQRGAGAVSCVFYNTYLMKVTLNVYNFLVEQLTDDRPWYAVVTGAVVGLIAGGPAGAWAGALAGLTVSEARERLDQLKLPLSAVNLVSAPDVEARASEIGRQLADQGFDLASLCEVWRREDLDRIADGVRSRGRALHMAVGPERTSQSDIGSGLVVLTMPAPPLPDQQIKIDAVHVFNNRGEKNKDTDAWSSKAVVLTRFDTGIGIIDLYTTHLYSGNDLPNIPPFLEKPDQGHIDDVKSRQCQEVVDFVMQTHNPNNVAIVVGDFNISEKVGPYAALDQDMRRANLLDQVLEQRYTFCTNKNDARIDHIFVEVPRDTHTFNVDVLPVRPFSPPGMVEGQLSDHTGLDFIALCSPLA